MPSGDPDPPDRRGNHRIGITVRAPRPGGLTPQTPLGQIGEIGWHPERVGYVFVKIGEVARAKTLSSGLVTRTQGYVAGIYFFRRRS